MTGQPNVILPLLILIAGAFSIYLVARLGKVSNKIESILTVLLLAVALAVTIVLIPDWFGSFEVF